uniref:V-set immunoregulatory receptor n=1 Tax=Cynoglossus semilaevis TaxID=244447 RepID=A0A3P8WQ31_CYNSE
MILNHCLKYTFLFLSSANGEMTHAHTISVSAPHLFYTCPEGATAKLMCYQRGAALYSTDVVRRSWLFTPHSDQHCSGKMGPRHTTLNGHSQGNRSSPLPQFGFSEQEMWVILQDVTYADQGRYCCIVLDFQVASKHASLVQKPHSHIILQVSPSKNTNVTVLQQSKHHLFLALSITACIFALLALPLLLVLVYKQREKTQSSNAQGHENPVFLGDSPQTRTRTVSQIMTRQSSETGRHLLSEPNTPMSPYFNGNGFFPIEDTIPESPDFVPISSGSKPPSLL